MKKTFLLILLLTAKYSASQEVDYLKNKFKIIGNKNAVINDQLDAMSKGPYSSKTRAAHLLYLETKKIKSDLNGILSSIYKLNTNNSELSSTLNSLKTKVNNALQFNDEMRYFALAYNKGDAEDEKLRKNNYYKTQTAHSNFVKNINAAITIVNTLKSKAKKIDDRNAIEVGNSILNSNNNNDDYDVEEFYKEKEKKVTKKNTTTELIASISKKSFDQLKSDLHLLLKKYSLLSIESKYPIKYQKFDVDKSELNFMYTGNSSIKIRVQISIKDLYSTGFKKYKLKENNKLCYGMVASTKNKEKKFIIFENNKIAAYEAIWEWRFYNYNKAAEYFYTLRELGKRLK